MRLVFKITLKQLPPPPTPDIVKAIRYTPFDWQTFRKFFCFPHALHLRGNKASDFGVSPTETSPKCSPYEPYPQPLREHGESATPM